MRSTEIFKRSPKKTEIFMRIFMFHLWLGFFFRSESVQLQCGFYRIEFISKNVRLLHISFIKIQDETFQNNLVLS